MTHDATRLTIESEAGSSRNRDSVGSLVAAELADVLHQVRPNGLDVQVALLASLPVLLPRAVLDANGSGIRLAFAH